MQPPLGNAAPSLDAVVHGNVLDLASFSISERESSTGFSARPLKSLKPPLAQMLPVVTHWHFSIGPEIRRDALLGVVLLWSKPVQREQLHWIDDELEGMLQPRGFRHER